MTPSKWGLPRNHLFRQMHEEGAEGECDSNGDEGAGPDAGLSNADGRLKHTPDRHCRHHTSRESQTDV